MDYFLSLTYTLLFLLSLAPLFFLLKRRSTGSGLPNLPPGSFGWPVIGETLEFFSEDPESFIRKRLEKHSTTVVKTNILGQNAVVISGAEANKLITSNENKLVKIWFTQSQQGLFGVKNSHAPAKPITNSNGLNKPPPGLGRLYGLLKPGPESVEKFDSLMKHQLRKFCPQGDQSKVMIRAYDLIRNFTLTASCDYLLGMEPETAVARLAGRFDDIVNGIQSIHVAVPGTAYYKAKKAAAAVRSEIEAVMKEKSAAAAAAAEGGDVVSKLIGEEKAMVAMGVAVANIVMGNMSASYGSVVTAMAFMVKFVGERPDVYDKIYSGDMYTIIYFFLVKS